MNAFEIMMSSAEDRAREVVVNFCRRQAARMGALGCRMVAWVYLRLERRADFNKRLRKGVEYRMAHAVWVFRAQRVSQWGGVQ